MFNKLFRFSILLFLPVFAIAQPNNINLSNTSLFGGEPYLAVNPTNHLNVVVAWMALDATTGFRLSIKSKASFDGGLTWGNSFVQPHFGSNWGSADVSMQFRRNGTLYLSYIDSHQPDSGGVYITHSLNGGISWSTPTQIWNAAIEDPTKRPLDRPWLAVDNSGSINDGMFYITTKPAPWIAPPNRPYLKTSSDSGQTWSTYRYLDTTGHLVGNIIAAPMAFPTVTADGALCAVFPSYLTTQSIFPKIFLAKSYSRGATFQYNDCVVNAVPVQDTLYKLGYRLASNSQNPNQLALAFLARPNGDPDVFLTTTNDGGTTWNTPVRVNDDALSNGKSQDMVWVSYDLNNKLVVTWRDRRNDSGSGFYQNTDIYCAVSIDNGNTFQPNLRLSNVTAAFDSILEQSGNDFLSSELVNDTIYAAWGDTRTGNLNIFFAKTSDTTGVGSGIISIDQSETTKFVVYPNPTSDQLIVSTDQNSLFGIVITVANSMGQEVVHKHCDNHSTSTTLDISYLKPGIYFITIGNTTYKLVKD